MYFRPFILLLLPTLFFCVAWPVFLDLAEFRLVLEDRIFGAVVRIPFPVGGVAIAIAVFMILIGAIISPRWYKPILSLRKVFFFWIGLLIPFFLYALYVAELSLSRAIQVLLPVAILSSLAFPVRGREQRRLVLAGYVGALFFFVLHLISIGISSADIWAVRELEFVNFFGYGIYQGLVSYPGVLSLYLIGALALASSTQFRRGARILFLAICAASAILLVLAARRVSLVELVGLAIIFLLWNAAGAILKGRAKVGAVITYLLCIPALLAIAGAILRSPLMTRFRMAEARGSIDGGRIEIFNRAISFFSSNPLKFFFGAGAGDSVAGFHNFFLDTLYRVGLLGMTFLLATLCYFSYKLICWQQRVYEQNTIRLMFLTMLGYSLVAQSLVNSPFTQPYYIVNFFFIFMSVGLFGFPVKGNIQSLGGEAKN